MIPAICVVGKSNVGKTTLLESLVPELRHRGYRIAVAKHINEEVELDTPGKDSWRLSRAGSDAVVLSTPRKVAVFRPEPEPSVSELQRLIGPDFDLFIIEGYKQEKLPKIEVRRGQMSEPLNMPGDLLAVVSDRPSSGNVPFFTFGNVKGLADLIEKRFLTGKSRAVSLYVNNKSVPLNPFVQNFIAQTVAGMVSAIKGVRGKTKNVTIWLKLTD
ncbi:MAG: molybdopterin-guanine dinucleotide biosynthesis protein B [Chloroflexota bacterium]